MILFEVEAWDTNCPQHIPQMFHAEDVARTVTQFQARIRELEAEVAALKGARSVTTPGIEGKPFIMIRAEIQLRIFVRRNSLG